MSKIISKAKRKFAVGFIKFVIRRVPIDKIELFFIALISRIEAKLDIGIISPEAYANLFDVLEGVVFKLVETLDDPDFPTEAWDWIIQNSEAWTASQLESLNYSIYSRQGVKLLRAKASQRSSREQGSTGNDSEAS